MSFSDGSIQAGARTLQIPPSTGATYVAESFNVRRPSNNIDQNDENNEPRKAKYTDGWVEGDAVLQLDTDAPAKGETFTTTVDSTIGAETFYITSVGQQESQGDYKKLPITFRKKVN